MGLSSAIWGGLIAALLGGSQYNIAGPTASGAGILAVYSLRYGYQILPFISILSGVLMIIALLLRLDKYVLLLPSGVMHGWTIGVAFTIAGNQLSSAFGINNLKRHEKFYLNVFEALSHLQNTQIGPFFIFLIAVVFIVAMGFTRPKVPWTIIVALTGIFLGILSSYDAWFFHMDTLADRFNGLKFSLFQTPTFKSTFFTGEIITASFSVAFISILESLLSAKVADRITNTRFAQPLEVFGIACANIIAGIFNGIPVTAALARTTLNVNSGATNRMAAILNAISCGVIAIILIRVLGYLPMCVIAALLVNVAIRMVNLQNLTHLWLHDTTMFRIAIFTALVTIFMDPAQGIIYGAVISIFLHGLRSSEAWSEITAANDSSIVVTHSSVELDRQALQDTFERQFPPTKRDDDENAVEMEAIGPGGVVVGGGAGAGARRDARQVPLDAPAVVGGVAELPDQEDEDDEDEEREELRLREQNRFFITAPKYKADHLVVRFPGELTYLNAEQHSDRLAPLLSTGRFLVLHLKRTYYIDMDGMDLLTEIVLKVEKMGKRVIVSGLTAQILPNLEVMDWFIRAREEDRIVANYRAAISKIREIDREDQRLVEERNYHDITMYELEESRRHSEYLAMMERARLHREEVAAKLLAEEKAREEEMEEKKREQEEALKMEIATRQARLDAKRKAEAEEFQKRLIEFEKKKQEREMARVASLAAIASSSIAGEPSISIPHHGEHHKLSSSSSLKLQETPVHTGESSTSIVSVKQDDHHSQSSQTSPSTTTTTTSATTQETPKQETPKEFVAAATAEKHVGAPATTAAATVSESAHHHPPAVPQVIIETPLVVHDEEVTSDVATSNTPEKKEAPASPLEPEPLAEGDLVEKDDSEVVPLDLELSSTSPSSSSSFAAATTTEAVPHAIAIPSKEEDEETKKHESIILSTIQEETSSTASSSDAATPAVAVGENEEATTIEHAAATATTEASQHEPHHPSQQPEHAQESTPTTTTTTSVMEPATDDSDAPVVFEREEGEEDTAPVRLEEEGVEGSVPSPSPSSSSISSASTSATQHPEHQHQEHEQSQSQSQHPEQQPELLSKSSSASSLHGAPTEETNAAQHKVKTPTSEPVTPPPESETSSVASDGPQAMQFSPRRDHPEPQAPLDLDDPLAQEPEIPSSDSAPLLSHTATHVAAESEHAHHETHHETRHESTTSSAALPPTTAPAVAPSTVSFLDPFADFEEASTDLSTISLPASSVHSTPAKTEDYVDPFDQFGIPHEPTTTTTSSAHTSSSSVQSTPQIPAAQSTSAAAADFDPFADLLSDSSPVHAPPNTDPDSEEELLL